MSCITFSYLTCSLHCKLQQSKVLFKFKKIILSVQIAVMDSVIHKILSIVYLPVLVMYKQCSALSICLSVDSFRYSCDICGKKYKYYSCFQEHRDLHAVDGNQEFLGQFAWQCISSLKPKDLNLKAIHKWASHFPLSSCCKNSTCSSSKSWVKY